ncbi:uncharacterized protein [Arachis hypogaea]|uniref:uncharacterized protein isoform X2 n=1 Tax=Arachis hypogaea TaxID=3818 RepID=UPI003B21F5EB
MALASNVSDAKLEKQEDDAFLFAQMACSIAVPMAVRTTIELGVFEIIAKEGEGAKLSAKDIVDRIGSNNPEAASMLDRVLRLLASHSLLSCSVVEDPESSNNLHHRLLYSLSPVSKYFVTDADGVSWGPSLAHLLDKVLYPCCFYHMLVSQNRWDFMWNKLTGTIPKEIGNIATLKLLLLNGNNLSGSLPDELGNLTKLNRFQVDENQLSGPILVSFANMTNVKHLHMNNNSFSGQLPPELSKLPNLIHLLMDNNNLSGYLPPEYSMLQGLRILQLDNNNFSGNGIPSTYANLSMLVKLMALSGHLSKILLRATTRPCFTVFPSLPLLQFSAFQ